ncbi:MAG TPA: DUF4179 domain-containing protein [Clostridiales bacterium]|nr:DUF4179 domain-containing protein [Clostridiales bacterium]
MAEKRYLDEFLESYDVNKMSLNGTCESDENPIGRNSALQYMDDIMKQKIIMITKHKLQRRNLIIRYAVAVCILLALLSSFIPNTPAYALRQKILSYIPGIGVVESMDETDIVTGVLAEPVKVTDDDKFVEIKSAFLRGNVLAITGLTNVGIKDAKHFDTVKEFKEFYSGETAPDIYLVQGHERTKAGQRIWTGPSYETSVYRTDAYFYIDNNKITDTFVFEMDGFKKQIKILLTPAKTGMDPEEIGNAAVIDDVMIFAHSIREKDIVEVLISIVAPSDFKNPRSYLFDDEADLFKSGVYLTDQSGTRYEPDNELRKSRDSEINYFYFHVPEDRQGLKLVIPQIIFKRDYKENNIIISMPKENKETCINEKIQLGSHCISMDKASLIPAGSEILPGEFKAANCLMIEASATTEIGSRESVLRIIPDIQVMNSLFHLMPVSQSIYAEFWDLKLHSGYSLIHFDDLEETKKIIINFSAELSMTGPWEIQLDGK